MALVLARQKEQEAEESGRERERKNSREEILDTLFALLQCSGGTERAHSVAATQSTRRHVKTYKVPRKLSAKTQ